LKEVRLDRDRATMIVVAEDRMGKLLTQEVRIANQEIDHVADHGAVHVRFKNGEEIATRFSNSQGTLSALVWAAVVVSFALTIGALLVVRIRRKTARGVGGATT
jgi:uncharacterized protein YcbX